MKNYAGDAFLVEWGFNGIGDMHIEQGYQIKTLASTNLVVSGEYMAADVVKAINDNDGSFTIPTVQGGELTATLEGENVILTDAAGNKSTVIMTDVDASNGVIHAIDAVVMPKS